MAERGKPVPCACPSPKPWTDCRLFRSGLPITGPGLFGSDGQAVPLVCTGPAAIVRRSISATEATTYNIGGTVATMPERVSAMAGFVHIEVRELGPPGGGRRQVEAVPTTLESRIPIAERPRWSGG